MRRTIILVMLSGVLTLHSFGRERYRILVRKDSDGQEIFIPMRKQHNGALIKEWVHHNNIYTSQEAAEKIIEGWKQEAIYKKWYDSKRYIYLN
jgi:hypothetical protein